MPLTQQRVDWLPCAAPPDGRRQTSVDHDSPPSAVAPYRSLARSAIAQGSKAASSQLGGEDGASAAAAKTRCVAHTPSATLPAMTPQHIVLRAATTEDASFIVEMARHACVIEDRPLPHPDDDEVLEMLPPDGVAPIIAADHTGTPVGAVWTYYGNPPLHCDAAGTPLPELCIAVAPGYRGAGIGAMLLDALFTTLATAHNAMCTNVHVRNPPNASANARGLALSAKATGR